MTCQGAKCRNFGRCDGEPDELGDCFEPVQIRVKYLDGAETTLPVHGGKFETRATYDALYSRVQSELASVAIDYELNLVRRALWKMTRNGEVFSFRSMQHEQL